MALLRLVRLDGSRHFLNTGERQLSQSDAATSAISARRARGVG
jgi:hypothetical protein